MSAENQGRTILEIGPRYNPLSELAPQVIENGLYVSLDKDERAFKFNSHLETQIIGDLDKLPLRECSFDQIWLLNVLGDPSEYPMSSIGLARNFETGQYLLPRRLTEHLREMRRILKPKGQLVIMEYTTAPKSLKKVEFEEYGFSKTVLDSEDEMVSFAKKNGFKDYVIDWVVNSMESRNWPSFIMILEKTTI